VIPLICKNSLPEFMLYQTINHFLSQHNRRVRCIVVCPINDHHFVTSVLNGVINLREVHPSGSDRRDLLFKLAD